jgi:hypothetical protein
MENNNSNPNTGSKGVFPGAGSNHTGAQDTAQEIQMPQLNIPEANQPANQPAVPPVNTAPSVPPVSAPVAAETNTYIRLETKNPNGEVSGVFEIDLISFRERGQESRYLSINTVGMSGDGEPSDTSISIDNETDFKRFKDFISNLNWND